MRQIFKKAKKQKHFAQRRQHILTGGVKPEHTQPHYNSLITSWAL